MPAPVLAPPSLSPPTVLSSHPFSPSSSSTSQTLQSTPSSPSTFSPTSTGEVVRLSLSSSSVKRARGWIVSFSASSASNGSGGSVTLTDSKTLVAKQSFVLPATVRACTPPLTVFSSASSSALPSASSSSRVPKEKGRTTFLGVASTQPTTKGQTPQSEIWIWREQGDEVGPAQPEKTVVKVDGRAASLHPLATGELLIRFEDESMALLKPGEPESTVVAESSSASLGSSIVAHAVSVLDADASTQLFSEAGPPRDDVLAVVVTFYSTAKKTASSSSSKKATESPSADSKGRRRKTAMEVMEEADQNGGHTRAHLEPTGALRVQVQLVLQPGKESDGERILSGPASITATTAVTDSRSLLDVDLYHDGQVATIDRDGNITMTRLSIDTELQPSLLPARSLPLRHIAPGARPSRQAAVVRLSSSHLLVVLQASSGPSSGKLCAHIWDTDLDALLITSDWSFPSLGSHAISHSCSLSPFRVGGSQIVVQGSFWATIQDAEVAVATMWALPFTIPEQSVLRHVVGKAALTNVWLKSNAGEASSSTKKEIRELDASRAQLLKQLQSLSDASAADVKAQENKATQMETTFTDWVSAENIRLKRSWEERKLQLQQEQAEAAAAAAAAATDGSDSDSAPENDGQLALGKSSTSHRSDKAPKVELSYSFVIGLLQLILPPPPPSASKSSSSTSNTPASYPRKILTYLLERRSVSCGMLPTSEPSLLSRLRVRNDWSQMMNVIRFVSDMAEGELVDLLVLALRSSTASSSAGGSSLNLEAYLSLLIPLCVSRPLLRSTLHARIRDVDDVVKLMSITATWLEERYAEPLGFPRLAGADEAGFAVAEETSLSQRRKRLGVTGTSAAKAPPLLPLLTFTQDLLDVYFPLLLSSTSGGKKKSSSSSSIQILTSLSSLVTRHLSWGDKLAELRAPLADFDRVDKEREREKEREKEKNKAPGAAQGQGQGQGKKSTGGKSARLQALENSFVVGQCTVEMLDI